MSIREEIAGVEAPELVFDEKEHVYRLGRIPVTGVTRAISSVPEELRYNTRFIRAGERGKAIHAVCEDIINGKKVKLDDLNDEIRVYVKQFMDLMNKGQYEFVGSERKVVSKKYMYAGTLDILALRKSDGKLGIMDLKNVYKVSPTTSLQTAAYMNAWNEICGPKRKHLHAHWRAVIHLTGIDEPVEPLFYKDFKGDLNVFLCKLTSHVWDINNGVK